MLLERLTAGAASGKNTGHSQAGRLDGERFGGGLRLGRGTRFYHLYPLRDRRHGRGRGVFQGPFRGAELAAENDYQLGAFLGYVVNRFLGQLKHDPGDAHGAGLELAGPDLPDKHAVDGDLFQRLKPGIVNFHDQLRRIAHGERPVLHGLVRGYIDALGRDPYRFNYGGWAA